jgi:hypothetical protein
MSGYELNWFINLYQNDSEDLICSICQDIFRDSVVTNLYSQALCEQCINNWLVIISTCPYDRKQLNRTLVLKGYKKKFIIFVFLFNNIYENIIFSSIITNWVVRYLVFFLTILKFFVHNLKLNYIYSLTKT